MKYLGYYDISNKEGRYFCLAATNKIDYICKSIIANGGTAEIVSASIASTKGGFKGGEYSMGNGVKLKKFRAIERKTLFQKIYGTIYSFVSIFLYLLFHTKKDEKIIVYHSLGYIRSVSIAKFFKQFHLVLEVEEIYGDVSGNRKDKRRELAFFRQADSYIFPTELLNQKINTKNKPYSIIHGTYNVEKQIADKFNDGRIHCVYAGTFDPRKGGGLAAVAAGQYLDDKYHIHILGFGSETEKELLISKIEEISKKTKCIVTYDGLLSGEEYIKFIQSCDIGLSTQNPDAAFNATSFPSKVLSYMTNGLRVVSIKIEALETSAVNDLLYYYEENNSEAIANVIKTIDITVPYDSRERIKELDKKFTKEIKNLLEKV